MNKKIKYLVSGFCLSLLLSSCNQTVFGVVKDQVTGKPIKEASVQVKGKEEIIYSDESGRYRIAKAGGASILIVRKEGFETFEKKVGEDVKEFNITLQPTAKEIVRRIITNEQKGDFEANYQYLHPNHKAEFSQDTFQKISESYATFYDVVKEWEIQSPKNLPKWGDSRQRKVYQDVTVIPVIYQVQIGENETSEKEELFYLVEYDNYWHFFWTRT